MVPFANWDMPVRYSHLGDVASHMHCRKSASIFDVSHMLQTVIRGRDRLAFIESLVVGDISGLREYQSTLSLFTNSSGGIIDDTVINKRANDLYVVSNAGCSEKDKLHLVEHLHSWKQRGRDVEIEFLSGKSLVALQGPKSASVLSKVTGSSDFDTFAFMTARPLKAKALGGMALYVSRCGYTGEDGFEIQIDDRDVTSFCSYLTAEFADTVKLAGLGARDSLRLESGLCLYGHDIDETTTPVEAGLTWTIGQRRRKEGNFLGADVILPQIKGGVSRRRVGLLVQGRPAREGALIFSEDGHEQVGVVTSGLPSPFLQKNIAMGYVKSGFHKRETKLQVKLRDRLQPAEVVKMPFVEHSYYKV